MNASASGRWARCGLVLGALGVVFGDIGTSPLYAMRECFYGQHALPVTPATVLGILSLVFWSLILIVSIKYLLFVMRVSNQGEGGILALLALVQQDRLNPDRVGVWLLGLGMFGAGLLFGDGVITPSMTVLSAVEGLKVATKVFEPVVVPITIGILVGLFAIQRFGTGSVGSKFGPIMLAWFLVIAILGVRGLLREPDVLRSLNPMHGLHLLLTQGKAGFIVLGAVFLAVTGAEALYADMGHFGAGPIRLSWTWIVLPALLLNYLGQGALLLHQPEAAANPFYLLAPGWALYPLVVLATAAAVIASQALISGTFSLVMQAVQLGFLPRIAVTHTSSQQRGQIYVPYANWALMVACIALVLGFRDSSALAGAYGIAVSLTMVITTVLFYFGARRIWHWPAWQAGLCVAVFLLVEGVFCSANFAKVFAGGWVPLLIGAVLFTIMSTWRAGRRLLRDRLTASSLPIDTLINSIVRSKSVTRVRGTAVFMAGNPQGAPLALTHNLKHNRVLHERNVLLTIVSREVAHVPAAERAQVTALSEGFYRVTGTFGFMDAPNVMELLQRCGELGLSLDFNDTTFFLSSETVLPTPGPGMAHWRRRLFAVMSRNAQRATAFFSLPPNRVVELGMQVEV